MSPPLQCCPQQSLPCHKMSSYQPRRSRAYCECKLSWPIPRGGISTTSCTQNVYMSWKPVLLFESLQLWWNASVYMRWLTFLSIEEEQMYIWAWHNTFYYNVCEQEHGYIAKPLIHWMRTELSTLQTGRVLDKMNLKLIKDICESKFFSLISQKYYQILDNYGNIDSWNETGMKTVECTLTIKKIMFWEQSLFRAKK